jgi:hypothetical protein
MLIRSRQLGDAVERVVRATSLLIAQVAITATPVEFGRAAGNWIGSVNTPATNADQPPDPSGGATIAKVSDAIGSYKLGGTIYIVNNVEYIVPLEEGHSKQAPSGMVAQAMAEGVRYVKKARIRLGG